MCKSIANGGRRCPSSSHYVSTAEKRSRNALQKRAKRVEAQRVAAHVRPPVDVAVDFASNKVSMFGVLPELLEARRTERDDYRDRLLAAHESGDWSGFDAATKSRFEATVAAPYSDEELLDIVTGGLGRLQRTAHNPTNDPTLGSVNDISNTSWFQEDARRRLRDGLKRVERAFTDPIHVEPPTTETPAQVVARRAAARTITPEDADSILQDHPVLGQHHLLNAGTEKRCADMKAIRDLYAEALVTGDASPVVEFPSRTVRRSEREALAARLEQDRDITNQLRRDIAHAEKCLSTGWETNEAAETLIAGARDVSKMSLSDMARENAASELDGRGMLSVPARLDHLVREMEVVGENWKHRSQLAAARKRLADAYAE